MKLPEYDNRPGPGMPLYQDSSDDSWKDLVFPILAIGLPLLMFFLFGSTLISIVSDIKSLFH